MKKIILVICLIGALFLGYYMMVFEPNNLQIERHTLQIEGLSLIQDFNNNNLPRSFDGARIVHLTDFHSLWFGPRERRVLKILEELEPDFVFITGDFVDPVTKAITDRDLASVKIFWEKLGTEYKNRIFGVLGNHDTVLVKSYLIDSGIRVLDNENEKIFLGKDYLYLIGVDDPWTGRDDLSKAMEGIESGRPKILLAHAAEIIYDAVEKNIDLVLVGHTHGGQVNIPFFGRLIQQLSKYGRRYTKGLFRIENTYLHVNPGIGTSVIPIRFDCPPEITLIKLENY